MSKSILNIKSIIGQYKTDGTDMPANMAYSLKNLFVDTKAGMMEGARDYSSISIGGSTAGVTFRQTLESGEVKDAVFFSPSKTYEIQGVEYSRLLVLLCYTGQYTLKFYGIPDDGDFDLVYDFSKDISLASESADVETQLVSCGDTLRIVIGEQIKWFGHLDKYMLYVEGEPQLITQGWYVEDAIVTTDGITIGVEDSGMELYTEDDDVADRIYIYAVSVVYDHTQDSSYLASRILKTGNKPTITIGIDTTAINKRITGIKLWRKVGEEGTVYSSMDFELYREYGVAYDTNDDYDYIVHRSSENIRALNSLNFYFRWDEVQFGTPVSKYAMSVNNGLITYGDSEEQRRHFRYPQMSYIIPLDTTKGNSIPIAGRDYFMSIEPGNGGSYHDFNGDRVYKMMADAGIGNVPFYKHGAVKYQSPFQFKLPQFQLYKISIHQTFIMASLVYGHCLDRNHADYNPATHDDWDFMQYDVSPLMNFQAPYNGRYRIYHHVSNTWLQYQSSFRLYPLENPNDDGSGVSTVNEHSLYSVSVMPENLAGNLLRVSGHIRSTAPAADPLRSAKIGYADGVLIDSCEDRRILFSAWDKPLFDTKPISKYVPTYNDALGVTLTVDENLDNVAGNNTILEENQKLELVVMESTGQIVDFQESDLEDVVDMLVDDQSKDDVHTNRFFQEEVGYNPKRLIESYKKPVLFGNRLFVVDESNLRWSESFKYDSFRPESVYQVSSEPKKLLPHHNALLLIYENNIDVLNYSGTRETWRTSDSLNNLGTSLPDAVLSTPHGIFMPTRYGIFMITSPETAGKMSYFNQQRIDKAIEGEIDLETALPSDLESYWDSEWQRIVLLDNRTNKQWVFSGKSGWMPIEGSAYTSFSKIIPVHDMLNIGICRTSNQPILAKLQFSGEHLRDYEYESEWIHINEPSVAKKFKKLYLNAQIPSAEPIEDEALDEPSDNVQGPLGRNDI